MLLESKLGLAIVRSGRVEIGLAKIRDAVRLQSTQPELHDRLILSLAWLGRTAGSSSGRGRQTALGSGASPSDFLRAGTLWANLREWPRAAAVLHVGSMIYPKNLVLKQALVELSAQAGVHVNEMIEKLTEEVQASVLN